MNWDKLKGEFDEGKDQIQKKGKAYKDILALKGQISSCKSIVEKDYIAIGKMYVEKFGEDNPYPEFDKKITEINNATNAIIELETRIEKIKSNM